MSYKYPINIFWSDEDEGYVALISEFPGLSAFGETPEEAAKEAQVALKGMIESLEENGLPLPKPFVLPEYSGHTSVRMAKTLHKRCATAADNEGISLNSFLCMAASNQVFQAEISKYFSEEFCKIHNSLEKVLKALHSQPSIIRKEIETSMFLQAETRVMPRRPKESQMAYESKAVFNYA